MAGEYLCPKCYVTDTDWDKCKNEDCPADRILNNPPRKAMKMPKYWYSREHDIPEGWAVRSESGFYLPIADKGLAYFISEALNQNLGFLLEARGLLPFEHVTKGEKGDENER